LKTPDAVSDLSDLATQLGAAFSSTPGMDNLVNSINASVHGAIVRRYARGGQPWFAEVRPIPIWNFDRSVGIGIYKDLEPRELDGKQYLDWRSHWYTSTVSADNPNPYSFLRGSAVGITWGDVLASYWSDGRMETAVCLPSLPPGVQPGEVAAIGVIEPTPYSVAVGKPAPIAIALRADSVVADPLVRAVVVQNGVVVFSYTVGAGYLITGEHRIDIPVAWVPASTGSFVVSATVDYDNRIEETNDADNVIALADTVLGSPENGARPVIAVSSATWIHTPGVALSIAEIITSTTPRVTQLQVDVFQYAAGNSPRVQLPIRLTSWDSGPTSLPLNNLYVLLPGSVHPGVIILHVWAWSPNGRTVYPTILHVNYAPNDLPISPGEEHYYFVPLLRGERQSVTLAVSAGGDANLLSWDPNNYWTPWPFAVKDGNDVLDISAPISGLYLVAVRGEKPGTTYTVSGSRNSAINAAGTPPVSADGQTASDTLPGVRPLFLKPLATPTERIQVFLPAIAR
jgi:hypothetical protein